MPTHEHDADLVQIPRWFRWLMGICIPAMTGIMTLAIPWAYKIDKNVTSLSFSADATAKVNGLELTEMRRRLERLEGGGDLLRRVEALERQMEIVRDKLRGAN